MQPVVIGDVMWEPSPEVISRSRLKRFMDQYGIESFAELLKRADDDIEWFWDAAIKDIDIAFYRHYVVDRRAHEHTALPAGRVGRPHGAPDSRQAWFREGRLVPLLSGHKHQVEALGDGTPIPQRSSESNYAWCEHTAKTVTNSPGLLGGRAPTLNTTFQPSTGVLTLVAHGMLAITEMARLPSGANWYPPPVAKSPELQIA
jgi:hypothetical protein